MFLAVSLAIDAERESGRLPCKAVYPNHFEWYFPPTWVPNANNAEWGGYREVNCNSENGIPKCIG